MKRTLKKWLGNAVWNTFGRWLVLRSVYESDKAAFGQRVLDNRRDFDRQLAEERKAIAGIVDRCSQLRFERYPARGDAYGITIFFHPEMMAMGRCSQDELRMIAREMGYRVEAEIATSRFVDSARQAELADRLRRAPDMPHYEAPYCRPIVQPGEP
jgi:hypothetical protein